MTAIVAPPAPIIPSTFPALGSMNFNAEAYAWGTSEPAVVARVGEIATNAYQNALASEERASAAHASAEDAADSAIAAASDALRLASLDALWLGASPSNPTTGRGGVPLVQGNAYINSVSGLLRAYNGSAWVDAVNVTAGVTSLNGQVGALSWSTLAHYGITDAAMVETAVNVITSNTTAVAGRSYDCDTTAGSFTLTLPASPSVGARVGVRDAKRRFRYTPLTLARNGQLIEGVADDLSIDFLVRGVFEFRGGSIGWTLV